MQVGMAEWSKSLHPVQGVVGLILSHDSLWKPLSECPCKIAFNPWYQTGNYVSVSLVGRRPLLETNSPPSSRALLTAAACDSLLDCLIAWLQQMIAPYCNSLLVVSLLLMWRRFEPPSLLLGWCSLPSCCLIEDWPSEAFHPTQRFWLWKGRRRRLWW